MKPYQLDTTYANGLEQEGCASLAALSLAPLHYWLQFCIISMFLIFTAAVCFTVIGVGSILCWMFITAPGLPS